MAKGEESHDHPHDQRLVTANARARRLPRGGRLRDSWPGRAVACDEGAPADLGFPTLTVGTTAIASRYRASANSGRHRPLTAQQVEAASLPTLTVGTPDSIALSRIRRHFIHAARARSCRLPFRQQK